MTAPPRDIGKVHELITDGYVGWDASNGEPAAPIVSDAAGGHMTALQDYANYVRLSGMDA